MIAFILLILIVIASTGGFIAHLWHETRDIGPETGAGTVFAMLCAVGFYIRHYGATTLADISKIFSVLRDALTLLSTALNRSSRAIAEAVEQTELRIPALEEKKSRRRAQLASVIAVATVCLMIAATAATVFFSGYDRQVVAAKQERLKPPAPPQPFDKRWEAPNEPKDIGGPMLDDPPTVAMEKTPSQPTTSVPKTHRKQKSKTMTNPWSFPIIR